jgi:hypothetical protein
VAKLQFKFLDFMVSGTGTKTDEANKVGGGYRNPTNTTKRQPLHAGNDRISEEMGRHCGITDNRQ